MSITTRDIRIGVAALIAFPLAVNDPGTHWPPTGRRTATCLSSSAAKAPRRILREPRRT